MAICMVLTCQNTLEFLSLQTCHGMSMARDSRPRRRVPKGQTRLTHQSSTSMSFCRSSRWMSGKPSQHFTMDQILFVNLHLNSKWAMETGLCLHNWEEPQFYQPQFWSLSTVQRRLWSAGQAKNLHFRVPKPSRQLFWRNVTLICVWLVKEILIISWPLGGKHKMVLTITG